MDNDDMAAMRTERIVRISAIGICANILLASFKLAVGLLSRSSAITADAVNNFSDAASSTVTIAGAKLAAKPADKKHPFGYGRIEYLSALLVGIIVLYAGLSTFRDGIREVISGASAPDYSPLTPLVLVLAIAAKILLGRLFISVGRQTMSDSLSNSGRDALFDSLISLAALSGMVLYKLTGILLEQYIATLISLFIVKAGFEMIRDTISKILGEAGDIETAKAIRDTILSFEDVKGAYDLVLNNYGPENFSGSVHIAVHDTMTAWEIDDLIRRIQIEVIQRHKVVLNAIGVYSINTKDEEIRELEKKIMKIAQDTEFIRQVHAFHVNKEKKQIRFDLVISLDAKNRSAICDSVLEKAQKELPGYSFQIAIDTDYFESAAN